jgi:phosphomannomutase|tara:strand:- start:210887 stop:212338 length:1452 start_codon:yes stop_codon:yes gene_type:complete
MSNLAMKKESIGSVNMNEGHKFDPIVLREYDVRGIVNENIDENDAYAIGRALGTTISRAGGSRVAVGRDGRDSSPDLAEAVMRGLVDCGLIVMNIGVGPSPMLYFTVHDRMLDGGVVVTGSHNPSQYNGFKMMDQEGSVFGEKVQELGRIAAEGDYVSGEGEIRALDVCDTYVSRLIRDLDIAAGRPLKVAWDCGNGAAGAVIHGFVAQLPGENVLLFDEVDGRFPNHHPDPTVDANLKDLRQAVLEQNCDLGIAFDGDADRIGVVDNKGKIIRCDTLIALYAADVLKDNPGAPIIGDIKCSQAMFDEITRLGGKAEMWKTGHSLIKSRMKEMSAPLAGELSGHIFFADRYYGFDDALYCAVRLLNIVANTEGGKTLNELLADFPELYNTPEIRFEVDESQKFEIVEKVLASLRAQAKDDENLNVSDTDGVRVVTPKGWWLLRASNTQNALTARVEASRKTYLEEMKEMLSAELEKLGIVIPF